MNDDTRRLIERVQAEARDARDAYRALPEEERASRALVEPSVPTDEEVLARCLEVGVRAMRGYRPPNVILGINERGYLQRRVREPYARGATMDLEATLYPGAEILALDASVEDGPDWDVVALYFGSMDLISARGGPVPLSSLTHLTCDDLLGVFKGKKTKVDVQVRVYLICKRDGARFSGYRLSYFQEEQQDAIQTRIEPSDRAVASCEEPFPRQRSPFRHRVALRVDTPVEALRQAIASIEALLETTPRVWPGGTAMLNGFVVPHDRDAWSRMAWPDGYRHAAHHWGHILDVEAFIQAADPQALSATTNALYLGIYEALKTAGAEVAVPPPSPFAGLRTPL